jgi:hypothetical protein
MKLDPPQPVEARPGAYTDNRPSGQWTVTVAVTLVRVTSFPRLVTTLSQPPANASPDPS